MCVTWPQTNMAQRAWLDGLTRDNDSTLAFLRENGILETRADELCMKKRGEEELLCTRKSTTGAHTQGMERFWVEVRGNRKLLQSHLDATSWRMLHMVKKLSMALLDTSWPT